jgi:hypothetical protein
MMNKFGHAATRIIKPRFLSNELRGKILETIEQIMVILMLRINIYLELSNLNDEQIQTILKDIKLKLIAIVDNLPIDNHAIPDFLHEVEDLFNEFHIPIEILLD